MDTQNPVKTTKKKVKKLITVAQAEEQHLLTVAKSLTTTSSTTSSKETKQTKTVVVNNMANTTIGEEQTIKTSTKKEKKLKSAKTNGTVTTTTQEVQQQQQLSVEELQQISEQKMEIDEEHLKKNGSSKKKTKPKKGEKGETDKQNISVKSSFRKFDALQKRSLIHVRSIDASTAQEKFSNPQGEVQQNCRLCDKAVYKMEEIKAEKSIYHKNCFRCNECNKQLKVDNYQSHEGVLYCTVHFKLLLAPKSVEDTDTVQPRKPELIIRENQPTELPPDVVRASDKPDLGLEELQQLNVRSRFQVFEQGTANNTDDQQHELQRNNSNIVRRSASIMSKVAKLQQLGSGANSQHDSSDSSENEEDFDDEMDFEATADNPNAAYIRQKKREQKREMPVGIGEAMNDIRSLFEKGHGMRKAERREECKQEIQNIRSRLFMGKQARIKEMYQQAVADSEHATDKKANIDIEVDSKSLRQRFENGEIFRENQTGNENEGENTRKPALEKEADVFESAISKKSRSIFMELDMVTGKNQNILPSQPNNRPLQHQKSLGNISIQSKTELEGDVVKCSEAVEDVKIETSEISEKFKFFEKYHPTENKKRAFRITPPREGVVKMPSPDENGNESETTKELSPDRNIIAHSRTTSMMLNKFRELEKNPNRNADDNSPKPLKCFTPPPDGNRRLYAEQDSDEYDSSDEDEEDEDESNLDDDDYYNNHAHVPKDDEALKEAQNAARAKQLRIKFEKWQANEIKREKNDEYNQTINNISDENIESTQSIRDRFEKMRNNEKSPQPTRPRCQVNRFV